MPSIDEWRSDILGHVTRLGDFWRLRDVQRAQEEEVRSLVEPVKKQGFENITLNEPKVLWDTATALLSLSWPRFRIPMATNIEEEEKKRASKTERFFLGLLREMDNAQLQRGQSSWLRQLAFWVCSGWYSCQPLVLEDDDGLYVQADLYDPSTVYPEWGARSLHRVVRKYETTLAYARTLCEANEWEFSKAGEDTNEITVINYWEKRKGEVWNAVLMANEFVKPPTLEEHFRDVPFIVAPVSGTPVIAGDRNWQTKVGESIIHSNLGMYRQQNRWVSLMMQLIAWAAEPPIQDFTKTGRPKLKKQDMGTGTIIPRELEERIEVLKTVGVPGEMNTLLSLFGQSVQRGGLPYIIYGGIPFELSGFAINQLLSAIRYKMSPYIQGMQDALGRIMLELLRQFKAQGSKITLITTDPDKLGKGQFFSEEFVPEDIPAVTTLEVTLNISNPQDRVQQIMAAKQALAPPQLLSRETLWEDFLDVQDTSQEYARIIGDQVNDMEPVKMIAAMEEMEGRIAGLLAEGKTEAAAMLKGYLDMLRASLSGKGQATPETPGVGPETSPPEMGATQVSPDVMRAMWGMGPPGLKRRPQTPAERTEKKQTTPIYGPRGEVLNA